MNYLFILLPVCISEFLFRMLLVTNNKSNHGFNPLRINFLEITRYLEIGLLAGLVV